MATLNPIHQSGSASSLTRLADTGCLLCSEDDQEKGEQLLSSDVLVNCKCSFMVHRSCWLEEIGKSGQKLCPSCQKVPIALNLITAARDPQEISPELSEEGIQSGVPRWVIVTIVLCILAVIVFSVGMVLASHKKS